MNRYNIYKEKSVTLKVIEEIPQQQQVQYDLHRQLSELRAAANRLGLYDAADFIRPYCGTNYS